MTFRPILQPMSISQFTHEEKPCELYSSTWVVFQPGIIIDAKQGKTEIGWFVSRWVTESLNTMVIIVIKYSKTPVYRAPIYRKPRFTAANFFPQIGLYMHIVNKQNPDLPRTPIYRGCFLSPKPAVNRGFTVHCAARHDYLLLELLLYRS